MTDLQEKIDEKIKIAMKEKDVLTKDTLRFLKGEIDREKGKKEVSNANISKLAKKLIEGFRETDTDTGQIAILEEFVLSQFSEEKLREIVKEVVAANSYTSKNMGQIMNHFKDNYNGLYDGKMLSDIVKEVLV